LAFEMNGIPKMQCTQAVVGLGLRSGHFRPMLGLATCAMFEETTREFPAEGACPSLLAGGLRDAAISAVFRCAICAIMCLWRSRSIQYVELFWVELSFRDGHLQSRQGMVQREHISLTVGCSDVFKTTDFEWACEAKRFPCAVHQPAVTRIV